MVKICIYVTKYTCSTGEDIEGKGTENFLIKLLGLLSCQNIPGLAYPGSVPSIAMSYNLYNLKASLVVSSTFLFSLFSFSFNFLKDND